MKKFLRKRGMQIAFTLAVILALAPLALRLSAEEPLAPGSESYFNLRLGNAVQENFGLKHDQLQGRPYNFNLYHYFLAVLLYIFNDGNIVATSVLLSLATFYLLYQALRNFKLKELETTITMLVFVLSPLYTYAAATITSFALTLFLFVLSLHLYSKSNKWYSLLPATLTILMDPSAFIVFNLGMFALFYFKEQDQRTPLMLLLSAVILFFLAIFILDYVPVFYLTGGLAPKNYITDLGAMAGYSFFTMLLVGVSVVVCWKHGLKTRVIMMILILLLVFSTISPSSRLILNIIASIYSALAIEYFLSRKWIVPILKDLTLLIIASSLLFSSLSFVTRTAEMEPTLDTVMVLESIKSTRFDGTVLTVPEYGFLIEYFSEEPAYLDGISFFYSDYGHRLEQARKIYTLGQSEETKKLLNNNSITFIFLDSRTLDRLRGGKSLLLVLEASENFIKLGEFQKSESWLYIRI